ncbi:MAG: nucleotidyl transferase AbiEii/AbiGii toxin family protein [Deltaproteobacteria bacterium]
MTAPVDMIDVAVRVALAFERAGVEYALGGSIASGLQGEPRATNDIDFAVRLDEGRIEVLRVELGADFAVDVEALRDAVRRGRSYNIYFLPTVVKIDLFVRGGAPFDESELSRKVRLELRPGEPAICVASTEDNLLRKLLWFRQGGEQSELQWRDVLGLVRVSGAELDRAYLEAWAARLGLADLLSRALAG